jgi:hypothetical protein|tara:strand:+ start:60 stop:290 length:231 start_codon:yes stop_codon:yes gene_type:complete
MNNQVTEKVLANVEDVILVDVMGLTSQLKTTIDAARRLCKDDNEVKQFLMDNTASRDIEGIKDAIEKVQMLLSLVQ